MKPEYEYMTTQQSDINFNESIKMGVKAPAIADRIFQTYADADAYLKDLNSSATAGLILSVINDNTGGTVNGIYMVKEDIDEYGEPYLHLIRQDSVQSDWLAFDQDDKSYIMHRPTMDFGTFTINDDGTVTEPPYAEGYMDYTPPTNN